MRLRKDTTFDRAMLSQEWREIVAAENAGEGTYRRVVLSIPFTVPIHVSLLPDTDQIFGADRTYKGPIARPGADMEFHLRPGQPIWAATSQGSQSIAVLIEYCQE